MIFGRQKWRLVMIGELKWWQRAINGRRLNMRVQTKKRVEQRTREESSEHSR